ncbi:MAG: hypothetical protein IJ767_08990 [Bacteroidaceae bacterium]|nr:hypothetical protein [Bacteroidaceae bacterium]MBR1801604.1 hypothetical protein [Bacteroidaceae bacterium]
MIRFTIYTYLFKPINEPYQMEMFREEVKADESMARKQEMPMSDATGGWMISRTIMLLKPR